MQNLNVKTNPARKEKAITGAVMALTTAAVMAMAPMSQAFASDDHAPKGPKDPKTPHVHSLPGQGESLDVAKTNAETKAKQHCTNIKGTYSLVSFTAPKQTGKHWMVKVNYKCMPSPSTTTTTTTTPTP